MADINKIGTTFTNTSFGVTQTSVLYGPSNATLLPPTNTQLGALVAGEKLTAYQACYIKTSDGKVYKAIATDGTANSDQVRGYAARNCESGQPITLEFDIEVAYVDTANYTPLYGNPVYLSTTAGALADATHYGGQEPLGFFTKSGMIRLTYAHKI